MTINTGTGRRSAMGSISSPDATTIPAGLFPAPASDPAELEGAGLFFFFLLISEERPEARSGRYLKGLKRWWRQHLFPWSRQRLFLWHWSIQPRSCWWLI